MTAERFLVRTDNGPCDGETRVFNSSGQQEFTWPLPLILKWDDTGYYRKYSESTLAAPPAPGILRGAQYHWVEFWPMCRCTCPQCDAARMAGRITEGHCGLGGNKCTCG